MDPNDLEEKWAGKAQVEPTGQYAGKTIAELKSMLSKLKDSGPHKAGSRENKRMKQIMFAIRAKRGWKGGVAEQSVTEKKAPRSPYAVGMAAAMKQTGDKPPLKKSTITRAHDIARAVMRDSAETSEPSVTEELESALATLKKLSGIQ